MLYLENAKKCFREANDVIIPLLNLNIVGIETEFYHNLAEMIPDRIDVDTLILAIKIALNDDKRLVNSSDAFIAMIPKYIEQCASLEFAEEFRKKYIREVLGIEQDEIPDTDYGINEVEKDVIDISTKDKGEVLAGLYNASIPVGAGFYQYNPASWTKEMGNYYLEHVAEYNNDGSLTLKYLLGRLVHVTFDGDLVYVAAYNYENFPNLAQKVIRACPNVVRANNSNRR